MEPLRIVVCDTVAVLDGERVIFERTSLISPFWAFYDHIPTPDAFWAPAQARAPAFYRPFDNAMAAS